jgi:hypothetical protein
MPTDFDGFSSHLFWDTRREALDRDEHAPYIVHQVVEYGLQADWDRLQRLYTFEELRAIALELRTLDPVTLSYLACFFREDPRAFRCYTSAQSPQNFWNS